MTFMGMLAGLFFLIIGWLCLVALASQAVLAADLSTRRHDPPAS